MYGMNRTFNIFIIWISYSAPAKMLKI